MKKQKLCSVIIPTLNEERYVPLLLDDLVNQQTQDFEVIVVDGDSDDDTQKKVMEFESSLDVVLIKSKKRNVSYQRNLGAKESSGEYLIFIDADSRVDPDFIQNFTQSVAENRRLVYIPKIVPQEGTYIDETLFNISHYLVEISQITKMPFPSMACMIFERRFFDFLGGYRVPDKQDLVFAEDQDIIIRARKAGVLGHCDYSLVVKFSLRRFKKDGRLSTISTYVLSNIDILMQGQVKQRNQKYEMGGHVYTDAKSNRKYTLKQLKNYVLKIQDKLKEELTY